MAEAWRRSERHGDGSALRRAWSSFCDSGGCRVHFAWIMVALHPLPPLGPYFAEVLIKKDN